MHAGQLVARHVEQQMMFEVIVHVVGRDEQPLQEIRLCGARIAQRIVAVGNDGVLGDVADASNHHHPGQQRHQPQEGISPPDPGRRKSCKQDSVGNTLRSEFVPKIQGALRKRPFRRTQRVEQLRFTLVVAGLPGDVADELAAIAQPRNRKRRRQHEIGIILLLRPRMMLQMIPAIGPGLGKNRIGAEPLAHC